MSQILTKDNLFRPVRSKAETKAQTTDSTARAIIDAEADRREAKTNRLREARLAMEADQPEPAPAKTRAKAGTKAKPVDEKKPAAVKKPAAAKKPAATKKTAAPKK